MTLLSFISILPLGPSSEFLILVIGFFGSQISIYFFVSCFFANTIFPLVSALQLEIWAFISPVVPYTSHNCTHVRGQRWQDRKRKATSICLPSQNGSSTGGEEGSPQHSCGSCQFPFLGYCHHHH